MLPLWIFTEGDLQRGMGHISRCSAYACAWKQRGGDVYWIIDGDSCAQNFIPDENISWICWQDNPGVVNSITGFALIDSYYASPPVLKKISDCFLQTVYLDDTFRLNYPNGLVVHCIPEQKPDHLVDAKWLMGIEWQPLRPAFCNTAVREKSTSDIINILIIIGATDIRNLTGRIFNLVISMYPNAHVNIISNNQDVAFNKECTIYKNINDIEMLQLMSQCDLAISSAGQTMFELAKCGLPSILVCVVDNQEKQFKWSQENSLFPNGIYWDDPFFDEKIATQLTKMSSPIYRDSIAKHAQSLIDGQGVNKLINVLIGS
ncbi:hypothetical protein [Aeromonas veronii]|uniref:hypothetical protein n=1 Tax=Aeromonas veronii TaxID=654 RepID=UPI001BCD5F04|nr:hypothetical protein [Aeromonas veronii]MBS4722819.1 hypothetical protein [Aeromonas veronii]